MSSSKNILAILTIVGVLCIAMTLSLRLSIEVHESEEEDTILGIAQAEEDSLPAPQGTVLRLRNSRPSDTTHGSHHLTLPTKTIRSPSLRPLASDAVELNEMPCEKGYCDGYTEDECLSVCRSYGLENFQCMECFCMCWA